MTDFGAWEHSTLARFARECFDALQARDKEIATLREELLLALKAYHRLLEKHAGKTN